MVCILLLFVAVVGVCLAWWFGRLNTPNVGPSCPMPFASPQHMLKEMYKNVIPFQIPAEAFPSQHRAPCYVLLAVRGFVNTSSGDSLRTKIGRKFPDSIFHNSECKHDQVKVLEPFVDQSINTIREIGVANGNKTFKWRSSHTVSIRLGISHIVQLIAGKASG